MTDEHDATPQPTEPPATESAASESAAVERIKEQRLIEAAPEAVFAVLTDPQGHVAIDSSGMLMGASGERPGAVGDTFEIHMDRESLNDFPLGRYDVTVRIVAFEPGREIAWTVEGLIKPPIGHVFGYRLEPHEVGTQVTSYYDWSEIDPKWRAAGIFPVISAGALRATMGILARVVQSPPDPQTWAERRA